MVQPTAELDEAKDEKRTPKSSISESEIATNLESETAQSSKQDSALATPNANNNNSNSELEDEFIFVDANQFSAEKKFGLKPGYKWKRELIFRSKLTMHTSYDRKDNSEPASVTAISISKDNKTIYVGDSRGRVYSWVCVENPGKARADHWVRDEVVESCKSCRVKFSLNVRKHHCRDCGGIFCNNCTRFETDIPRLHIKSQVRVCQVCYNNIKSDLALNNN